MLGFFMAILVSRGFYLKILKEHYNWLYFYLRNPNKRSFTSKLRKSLANNFWYLLLAVLVVTFFVSKNEILLLNGLLAKVIFWAFIPVLTALFVSIPALSFLGEEYRYVDYGAVPVGIAISLLCFKDLQIYMWLVSIICVFMCFIALFKFKKYIHESNSLVHPDDISSYHTLRNFSARASFGNLLVVPHIRTMEVNFFTGLNVVHLVRPKKMWASGDIKNLLNRYEIKFVLKFKGCTSPLLEKLMDTVHTNKILELTNLELYRLIPEKHTSL